MTTPDEPVPPPIPQASPWLFSWYGGIGVLCCCAKMLGLGPYRPAPYLHSPRQPAVVAPVVPARPQISLEQAASGSYWSVLGGIMRDAPKSGTTLLSIATDFQIKADQIRRLDPQHVDPAALRCGEAVAAYYSTIARVYRYSLSGAHSLELIAQAVSGKDNGVVGRSVEALAEMAHRRAEAVSAANAAHFALQQRFGTSFPALPAIR